MKHLYSMESVEENIEKYMSEGYARLQAVAMSIAAARTAYKKDNPATSTFPKHLAPGGVINTYMKGEVSDGQKE